MRRIPRPLLLAKTRLASAQRQLAQSRLALSTTRKQAAVIQQRLDSLCTHNPDAVYSLDRRGHFLSVNEACTTFSGYGAQELLGLSSVNLILPEDVARAGEHFLKAVHGAAQDYELTIVHKSGRRVELHVTNIPIVINDEVVGVYGVAKDITLRRRLLDLTRPMSSTVSVEAQVKLILGALREVL